MQRLEHLWMSPMNESQVGVQPRCERTFLGLRENPADAKSGAHC